MTEKEPITDFMPLNPENCWEVPKAWNGFAPGTETIDGKKWLPLSWVTGDLEVGGLVDDLTLASRGMVVVPGAVRELSAYASRVSQEDVIFGSEELKSVASSVFQLINSEKDGYLDEHYRKLAEFIESNEGGLMRVFKDEVVGVAVSGYVCGIQLDSIKQEDGDKDFDRWNVSLIVSDRQGNVGTAPRHYQGGSLLVRDDLVQEIN